MNETPRVLALVPRGSDGCLLWRHQWPSQELAKHGYIADVRYFDKYKSTLDSLLLSNRYNCVVTPRYVWREQWMVERFNYLRNKAGMKWIYETDDDFFGDEIIERSIQWNLTKKSELDMETRIPLIRAMVSFDREERIRILDLVDGMTVSTQELADRARAYTQTEIHVVQNAMHVSEFRRCLALKDRFIKPLTIGWTGGFRPEADLTELGIAWSRIADRFPEVTFVLHGWDVPAIVKMMPAGRLRIVPWCDLENYPAELKNIDIGCCSVENTQFNLAKSCIKFFELSMAGAACVGSHALYGNDITDGYDGLLATTADEWEEQLARLIVDVSLRKTLQKNAEQTVLENHNLELSWPQWINAWSSIMNHASNSR